ncbi:MAG: lipopolysaccharide transport periplasmic protein LptA [Brachymonas sp.]|nr:lipopolysaccharide transport periplasmic protein LptA [Brachymonas sp.]
MAPIHAELADRTKPMHIEADSMRYDDIGKITNATGRVIATKGTLLLRADAVEVRQDAQGNNFMVATASAGNQVFMRQKREGLNEFYEAQANRAERNEKTLITTLSGKASLRRLAGNTLADEVQGETIVYNEATEVYNVTSGAAGQTSPSGVPSGRVRATIAPRTPSATAPAPATAPSSAPRRSTTLQASPQIGGGQ